MSIPAFAQYPLPQATNRAPTNNCYQRENPATGKLYSKGTKASAPNVLVPMHGGSDCRPSVPGKVGEAVRPVQNGRVVGIDVWGVPYRHSVLIQHSHTHKNGDRHVWYTFYAHLGRVFVKVGQAVTTAIRIGTVGPKTVYVSGSHVHFAFQESKSHKRRVIDPYRRLDVARLR